MAIATKRITSGILARADANFLVGAGFTPISNCSDWFESRHPQANHFSISVVVNLVTLTTPTTSEQLLVDLFESDDLSDWSLVGTLSLSPSGTTLTGRYSSLHAYTGTPKKYFRLQFRVDDPSVAAMSKTMPFPDAVTVIQFDGACWVTVAHL